MLVVLLALQLDQTPVFKEVTPYLVALLVRVADTDVAGTSLAQASPAVMAGLVAAYPYIPGASKNEYTELYLDARAATDAAGKEQGNAG